MKAITLTLAAVSILALSGCASTASSILSQTSLGQTTIANPWTDFSDNLKAAASTSGFEFPLTVSNSTVRAMDGMIEVTYPLSDSKSVTVRKAEQESGESDISGDYSEYKDVYTKDFNGISVTMRCDANTIYVIYFTNNGYCYSAACEEGMTIEEAEGVFKIISEAENFIQA